MRIGFIGCVHSSRMALETLLSMDGIKVSAVVTRDKSAVNSDFSDLSEICIEEGIPFHFEDPKERGLSVEFLNKYDLDVIYCIGWSYLLDKEMLSLTKMGVIGFHPAKLPRNRGRHPIIWALALGLRETASTFFRMDLGADSGPIVSQETIQIADADNAQSLYGKVLHVAQKQIQHFSLQLLQGKAIFKDQDHSKATYWRKRSRKDGSIDFRMSAIAIQNLVRALAPPYPCAEFLFNDKLFTVPCSLIATETYAQNIEPGKILDKNEGSILVKVADTGAIWLQGIDAQDFEVGQYL
jgi:methionyl-tRNA formyltransferase